MKYLKLYKIFENIINPLNMDKVIELLIENDPSSMIDANELILNNGFDDIKLLTYEEFIETIKHDKVMMNDVPPKQFIITETSGIYFGIMNPHTVEINIVVNFDIFMKMLKNGSEGLINIIKSMLSHESIHKQQYNKMGNLKSLMDLGGSPASNVDKYLSHHSEIMAYAFSFTDELKRGGISKKGIIDIIQKGRGYWILDWYLKYFDEDSKVMKKFRKYVYLYTEKLFPN